MKVKGWTSIFVILMLSGAVVAVQQQRVASITTGTIVAPELVSVLPDNRLEDVMHRLEQRIATNSRDYEARLLRSLINFHNGDLSAARRQLDRITADVPQFHLAQLIRGDLISARIRNVTDIGSAGIRQIKLNESMQQLNALREEALVRLQSHLSPVAEGQLPLQLLQLAAPTETAILVDKSRHRLYLFSRGVNGEPFLQRDFYISLGKTRGNKFKKGDLRTPEGVYHITSWLADDKLPDKYGVGAFPVNYPNVLDQRLGKTGNGIWLHGTDPIYYSRPPYDSEGCVVLANVDLLSIRADIKPGVTPMIIADKVDWVSRKQWLQQQTEITSMLSGWRRDWESLNTGEYLSHYARGFWNQKHNLASWKRYKQRIAKQKSYQKITIRDLSLYVYPANATPGKPMVVAKFTQNYRSNNFNSETKKSLYLTKENGAWRILYEGR